MGLKFLAWLEELFKRVLAGSLFAVPGLLQGLDDCLLGTVEKGSLKG